jgi:hypothetical protein
VLSMRASANSGTVRCTSRTAAIVNVCNARNWASRQGSVSKSIRVIRGRWQARRCGSSLSYRRWLCRGSRAS